MNDQSVPARAVGQEPDEFEIRADGKRVRKDRWEWGIRRIVALMWGNRHAFEVDEVVEAVRKLVPEPFDEGDDEGLCRAVQFAVGQEAPAGLDLTALRRYLHDTLAAGTVNEQIVANTAIHLLNKATM